MPTHVALLRGINVGGRNKVTMADLREVATSLGYTDVATYIQSGNVVFTSRDADTAALAAALEHGIAESIGVRPRVVVLSRAELAQVIADNPFPDESDPKCLHAVIRMDGFGPDEVSRVEHSLQQARQRGSRDDARVVGGTLYLRTPDGLARSELGGELARPRAETTARNWSTISKLMALLDD